MEESRAVRAMVEQNNELIRSLARTPTEMASWIETVREGELPYSSRNYLFQCLEREAEKSLPKGKRFSEYDVTDAAQDRRRGVQHVLGSACGSLATSCHSVIATSSCPKVMRRRRGVGEVV